MATLQSVSPPLVPGRFRPAFSMQRNVLEAFDGYFRDHGDLVRVVLGPPGADRELWLSNHPDAAARILSARTWRNYAKQESVYQEIRYWLGDGLLTAEGDDDRSEGADARPDAAGRGARAVRRLRR